MPYIDFTRQAGINNKGSVSTLTHYLNKEDKMMEKNGKREFYFDLDKDNITKKEVDKNLDTNRGGLKKKDAKFYMITINPSKEELAHIGTDANKFRQWIQQAYIPQLARDFNRKGLKASDLNIYGKIERHRYYKGTDKEVQQGLVKSGEAKPGNNMHCHLILGRKSKDKKHYLSPNANARKQGQQGAAIHAGFNRNTHKISIEQSWDRHFSYDRNFDKSFEVQQGMKECRSIEEKASIINRYEENKTHQKEMKVQNTQRRGSGTDIGY
ncbi:DUF5712 family protein [Chondrinema litorale]|uniref:DUF5712 family protein n=1 Tax=Chondrinema litorale TaxID=2994555 RepID=UPI0025436802|nr:DUF5712 family protein [Chondrinema litorale]UZS00212.1 DUF5712 family protein [Chondrinema litorale]